MVIADILLYVLVIAVLIFAVVARIRSFTFRGDIFVYLLPTAGILLHLAFCGVNLLLLPLILTAILLLLLYLTRKRKVLFAILVLLAVIPIGASIIYPRMEGVSQNFASLSYTQAFSQVNDYLSRVYPLASHKSIDFEQKYEEFYPLFVEAEKTQDKMAFYDAMNTYLASFHDGHISVFPADAFVDLPFGTNELIKHRIETIGGDLGFGAMRTDDGRILAVVIDEKGAAFEAGLRTGDELLLLDGQEAADAADEIPLNLAPQGSADENNRMFLRFLMLGRCPVSTSMDLRFVDAEGIVKDITLIARENSFDTLDEMFNLALTPEASATEEDYQFQTINNETAVMRIETMMYDNETVILERIKSDLTTFSAAGGRNLIIDLRQNGGGEDRFGAALKALFTDEEDFYLAECVKNSGTDELVLQDKILVDPQGPLFDGEIVILVNARTASAAEGFAYNMAELPNVSIAGMNGSDGSFGALYDGFVLLPGNFLLMFPNIACTDENLTVIVDADENGFGGVLPDIDIPMDTNSVQALFVRHEDYELNYVLDYLAQPNQ